MRTVSALATTFLFLLFLTAVPAHAQNRDDTKTVPQQEGKEKEKDKAAKPGEEKGTREQPARQEERKDEEGKQNNRRSQPEASRPQEQGSGQQVERSRAQRPVQAQRGKRIPDERFRASFGPQHTFHVQRTQIVNNPQPTIVYAGYSFVFVDPWPVMWRFDDPVFIDFVDDEYFVFDPLYPGVRVALVVVE